MAQQYNPPKPDAIHYLLHTLNHLFLYFFHLESTPALNILNSSSAFWPLIIRQNTFEHGHPRPQESLQQLARYTRTALHTRTRARTPNRRLTTRRNDQTSGTRLQEQVLAC